MVKELSTGANIKIQLSFIKLNKEILKKCEAIPISLPIGFHFGKQQFLNYRHGVQAHM